MAQRLEMKEQSKDDRTFWIRIKTKPLTSEGVG